MSIQTLEKTTFLVTCAAGWEQRAKEELRRGLRGIELRSLFMRGNLLLTCDQDQASAIEALADLATECIGRIVPLHVRCDIGKGREYLPILAAASDLLPGPSPEGSFRAKCERRGQHEWTSRDAEAVVGSRVQDRTQAPFSLTDPDQVVSIEVFQDVAFLGVAWVDELLHKQITRMRKYAPGTRPLNRAELKLREIIEHFDLQLPPDGRALDLGAAPGGWTKVLAEQVGEVVAVDPGELDERVRALSNVRHLRMRVETLLEASDVGQFDIVTNDMNLDPADSARLLCQVARLLKPGAPAVMTVKFMTRRRRQHVEEALAVLSECFEDPQVGRVPHNALETTVVVRALGATE